MGDDSKTTKYGAIAKGVPILSETTRRLWQYKLQINTLACDNELGKFIFGDPKMMSELGLAPVFLTAEQKQKRTEWEENKVEFEKRKEHKKLLEHAHSEILKTLDDHDVELLMDIYQFS